MEPVLHGYNSTDLLSYNPGLLAQIVRKEFDRVLNLLDVVFLHGLLHGFKTIVPILTTQPEKERENQIEKQDTAAAFETDVRK